MCSVFGRFLSDDCEAYTGGVMSDLGQLTFADDSVSPLQRQSEAVAGTLDDTMDSILDGPHNEVAQNITSGLGGRGGSYVSQKKTVPM